MLKNRLLILFLIVFTFCATGGYYINAISSKSEDKIVLIDNEDPVESNTLNFSEEGQLSFILFKFKNQMLSSSKLRFQERQNPLIKDVSISPETPPPNYI